jgi:L-asparaginase
VVVVQGTDTLEETAFALDLLAPGDRPVVVTGAMRAASDEGYEGPVNLRAAVRVAAHPGAVGQGGLVVLDGRILPADDATKTHTTAYETFQALNSGPLGTVDERGVRFTARRVGRRVLPRVPEHAAEPVPLVTATLGDDGRTARLLHEAGLRGLVVAATGTGNTHPGLLDAAREVMAAGHPVVLSTRAHAGPVKPAYAFPGGGADWARSGAILAGSLPALKARVLLALALGAGVEGEDLRGLFDPR